MINIEKTKKRLSRGFYTYSFADDKKTNHVYLEIKSILLFKIKKACYFLASLITLLATFHISCEAGSEKVVNILTRYEYLRSPKIASTIKNKCGVEISYDEYYHPNECLRRFLYTVGKSHSYDIIIFPSVLYGTINKLIEKKYSNLNQVSKKYSSNIRDHYLSRGYPNNVVYFALSLSGFIWNPVNIKISTDNSIFSMFKKAKSNIVLLLHNYPYIWTIFDDKKEKLQRSFEEVFRDTVQSTYVYITNGRKLHLYDRDEFAFAYERANEAILVTKFLKNKKLNFSVHPKYSYIIPDLLAELNIRKETQCVARVLASKEILDIVQREMYYLSPYGTYKFVSDSVFQDIYRPLFNKTYVPLWADTLFEANAKKYSEIRNAVHEINLLPRVNKAYGK